MTVTTKVTAVSLGFQVETGVSDTGAAIYATRTISKINPALVTEKAYSFVSALANLQSNPVSDYFRTERSVFQVSA